MLTEADVRLLAQAIKAGTAPDPPTGGDVVFELGKLFAVVLLLGGVYAGLHWWHPHVRASFSGDAGDTLTSLTLGSGRSAVRWALPGIYATTVALDGPANQDARLSLPLAATNCPGIAAELALTCRAGALVEPTSIAVVSSSPQLLYLAPPADRPAQAALQSSQVLVVQLASSSTSPSSTPTGAPLISPAGTRRVSLSISGAGPLSWCTATPVPGSTVTLESGTHRVTLPAIDLGPSACTRGLSVDVQTTPGLGGQGRPPQTAFDGVSSLTLQATSGAVDVRALGGTLHLGDAGSDTLAPAAEVTLSARSPNQIHTTLAVKAGASQLALNSAGLASATTGGSNLVTSWWDRENSIALPLFLALCGAPLTLFPSLVDKLRKWRRATAGHGAVG